MPPERCDNKCEKKCDDKQDKNYPFEDFPTYLEIKIYLGEICRKYPHIATLEIIGITVEMAEIYMIKLQKDPCSPKAKHRPIIFVDATIHAREWLTTTTATYLINYIIHNDAVLDNMSFFVVPCVNVDGYMFSMEKKCYRLWRKNRTNNCSRSIALQGVDLNRNFPIGFGMAGSSDDPGAFNYRGEDPISEPATQGLSFALDKYSKNIKLYVSLHCYGNAILYPWSFTTESPPDCQDLKAAGIVGQQAILKASGGKRKMRVGNAARLMSLAAGTSTDYARYVHLIKFSYIFELQGYGPSGFTPKRRHIPEIGLETTMAIFAMARHCVAFFQGKGGDCHGKDAKETSEKNDVSDMRADPRACRVRRKRKCVKRMRRPCKPHYPSAIEQMMFH